MSWYSFFKSEEKRSNEQATVVQEPVLPNDPAATSVLFRGYTLDGQATSLSAFFAAMELISNSVAQLPILVKNNSVIDKAHNLNFLFNDMLITKFMFMKTMIKDVILYGNAYAYIERANDGTPINIIYCEQGTVNISYNKQKQELYYNVSFINKKSRIEPINMIHLYKNTNDGVKGISLSAYAQAVLKLAQATDKAASKYYSSGCALQGALTIKGSRRGAKEQARQAFTDTHSGKGSGLVILDDDMSYQQLSSNANDSQMIEARQFNVAEIARYFNINPILLGDNSGATFSSIEYANIEFIFHTLQPYITLIEEEFNRKLVKPSEQGYIKIDIDEKFLLKGDMKATSEYLSKLTTAGILTINEARAYLDLKPVEGGDEVHIPYTDVAQNTINQNTEETDGEVNE
jgi:HK97 family phage portal protein